MSNSNKLPVRVLIDRSKPHPQGCRESVGRVESYGAVTLPLALIQQSAWKENSRKLDFRFTEFSEVGRTGACGAGL